MRYAIFGTNVFDSYICSTNHQPAMASKNQNPDKTPHSFKDLEEVFDYVKPAEMRRSIQKVFFNWLIENKETPKEIKQTAENFWYLLEYLERKV